MKKRAPRARPDQGRRRRERRYRAARAAGAAAIGAGILLQAGPTAEPLATPSVVTVAVRVALDDPGAGTTSSSGEGDRDEGTAGDAARSDAGDAGGRSRDEASGGDEAPQTGTLEPSSPRGPAAGSAGASGTDPNPSDATEPAAPEPTSPRTNSPAPRPAHTLEARAEAERTDAGTRVRAATEAARDAARRATDDAARTARQDADEATLTAREAVRSAVDRADRISTATGPAPGSAGVTAIVPATSDAAAGAPVAESIAGNVLTRVALALAGVLPGSATSPSPAPSGSAAAVLLAQWALFRRGEHALLNGAPTASAAPPVPTTGAVEGVITATDPDRDRLIYTVGDRPQHGTVVVHDDGSYTYTPGDDLARTGGTDRFTVVVRDDADAASSPWPTSITNALHDVVARTRPDLADRLFGAHDVTVQVDVEVVAANEPPALPVTPPPATVDARGTVSGSLGIVDPDGDPLTFEVSAQPAHGVVSVDGEGNYVYVPSAAAQISAARTPGPDYDTFTVIVREGTTGSQSRMRSAGEMQTFGESTGGGKGQERGTITYTRTVEIAPASTPAPTIVDTIPTGGGDVRWSADGRRAFFETPGGSVTVVEAATGATTTIPIGTERWDVVLTPDGEQLYVSNRVAGTVTIFDTADGSILETLDLPAPPGDVKFSPDGRRAYVTDRWSGTMTVIDTGSRTVVGTVALGASPSGMTFSPDGRHAYVSGPDGMTIIDTWDDGTTTLDIGRAPYEPVFLPDGRYAYIVSPAASRLTVIDVADGSVAATVPVGSMPNRVTVSPDGRRASVVSQGDHTLTVIDTETHRVVTVIDASWYPNAWFSPDGRLAYLVEGRDVTVIDVPDGTLTVVHLDAAAGEVRFNADGTRAYIRSADGDETITVIDTATSTVVSTLHVGGSTGSIRFSPDGTRAYIQRFEGEGSTLVVIDTATDTIVASVPIAARNGTITFSPDGGRLYVTQSRSTVVAVDTAANVVTATVQVTPRKRAVSTPQFTPDGRYAYFRAGRGEEQRLILMSTVDDQVTTVDVDSDGLTFSPDGRYAYADDGRSGGLVVIDLGDPLAGRTDQTTGGEEELESAA